MKSLKSAREKAEKLLSDSLEFIQSRSRYEVNHDDLKKNAEQLLLQDRAELLKRVRTAFQEIEVFANKTVTFSDNPYDTRHNMKYIKDIIRGMNTQLKDLFEEKP